MAMDDSTGQGIAGDAYLGMVSKVLSAEYEEGVADEAGHGRSGQCARTVRW